MEQNLHIKLGEQFIDQKEYGDLYLEDDNKYPVIKIVLKGKVTKSLINMMRNSLDYTKGEYYLALNVKGNNIYLGKIDLNIDNIYKLEGILERMDYSLILKENETSEYKSVCSKDLVGTIQL